VSVRALHDLLAEAAAARPEATAVVDGSRSLTYGDLDRESRRVAGALAAAGVRPGDRVGLLLPKSLEAVAALYGTLRAGAVCVPLDVESPQARLVSVARDAGLAAVVGSPLPDVPALELAAASSDAAPAVEVGPDDLAYLLYTSGSTGEPKGVALSHGNVLAFVGWAVDEFGVGPADRLASHAPLHFDLSTFDLFAAASGGAAVVLVPPDARMFPVELARFLRSARITISYSVPSALALLAARGGLDGGTRPDALRAVLFAGDVPPPGPIARLRVLLPEARFCNLYGPTETNVCTWYELPPYWEARPRPVPIGRPIRGVEVELVDAAGVPVPSGEVGELVVRGPTVMQGYWGDPAGTAAVLSEDGGARSYRTGDLAREDEDGNLVFVGRRDQQVKVRGHRVELGEVEAALAALPGVRECAVVAVPDEAAGRRLRAFVAAEDGIAPADLARGLGELLPPHIVPDEFVLCDELPRSATGKVDRRRLAAAG
jgi:L-proline---[L-prolyl-carrier protein] ligase